MSTFQLPPFELDALVQITEILTGHLPFTEKCKSALVVLAEFTDSDLVTIREFDSENSTLDIVAAYPPQILEHDFQIPQSVWTHLTRTVVTSRSVIVANDYLNYENRYQEYVDLGLKSAVSVPVHVNGELWGTLGFGSKSTNNYQAEKVRVVAAIAATVGMMMVNAELQEVNEVLAEVGRIVSSSLIGPDVFVRFAEEAARIIDFNRITLNSVDIVENTFFTEFLLGDPIPNAPIRITRAIEGTVLEEAVRTRVSQRIRLDESAESQARYPRANPFFFDGQPCLISVPLIVGDQVIGTMGIIRGPRAFSQNDVNKAERLGNLVAGAFADFKQNEYRDRTNLEISKNRAVSEAEANIGLVLSSPSSRADVFGGLRDEIANIIAIDRILITSVDLDAKTYSQDFDEFLNQPELKLVHNVGKPYAGSLTANVVSTGIGQILNSDDLRFDVGQYPVAKIAFDRGYRSIMIVPLKYDEEIIGVFGFFNRFTEYVDEDIEVATRIGKLLVGALVTFRITAERDRAESALSESDRRFRQIADSIGGVFWLIDLKPRRLVYASPNFESVWNVPLDSVYEDFNQWNAAIHEEDKELVMLASKQADELGIFESEYRILDRDDSVRWVHSRGFPITDENGTVYRMSGIAEDITARKLELERITEAGRLLSVGELASGVAHEINNPLAIINLSAEEAIADAPPGPISENLEMIRSQVQRASTIVKNLLWFARESSAEIEKISPRKIIERCVALKRHNFDMNNIAVTQDFQSRSSDITIDERLMTQVLLNILTNAEQACVSTRGGGNISIIEQEIDGMTRISITDDGGGIEPKVLAKVFDPFFTTKVVGEGTGLGLSVSYGIVTQLGGRLWAESDGASETTFHVEVPLVLD